MAYASATTAQTQALRDSIVNAAKMVERVQEGGQSNASTFGPTVDTYLASLKTALDAVVAAGSGS